MSRSSRFLASAAIIACLVPAAASAQSEASSPLGIDDIVAMLRAQVPAEAIIARATSSCLAFTPGDASDLAIYKAGGDVKLTEALRGKCVAAPRPAEPAPQPQQQAPVPQPQPQAPAPVAAAPAAQTQMSIASGQKDAPLPDVESQTFLGAELKPAPCIRRGATVVCSIATPELGEKGKFISIAKVEATDDVLNAARLEAVAIGGALAKGFPAQVIGPVTIRLSGLDESATSLNLSLSVMREKEKTLGALGGGTETKVLSWVRLPIITR